MKQTPAKPLPTGIAGTFLELERMAGVLMCPIAEMFDHIERLTTPKPGAKPITAATITARLKGKTK